MNRQSAILFAGMIVLTGCTTSQFPKPDTEGHTPWIVVNVVSPDVKIPKAKFIIYRFTPSPSDQETIFAKALGKGHAEIDIGSNHKAVITGIIEPDDEDPTICMIGIMAGSWVQDATGNPTALSGFSSWNSVDCKSPEFTNPFFSFPLNMADEKTINLNLVFSTIPK